MFDFAIPKANYKAGNLRALDGSLISTLVKIRRCAKKGTRNRRLISEDIEMKDGKPVAVHTYHATKGWRSAKP